MDKRIANMVTNEDTHLASWNGEFTNIEVYLSEDGIKVFAGGNTAKESRGALFMWDTLEKMRQDTTLEETG